MHDERLNSCQKQLILHWSSVSSSILFSSSFSWSWANVNFGSAIWEAIFLEFWKSPFSISAFSLLLIYWVVWCTCTYAFPPISYRSNGIEHGEWKELCEKGPAAEDTSWISEEMGWKRHFQRRFAWEASWTGRKVLWQFPLSLHEWLTSLGSCIFCLQAWICFCLS